MHSVFLPKDHQQLHGQGNGQLAFWLGSQHGDTDHHQNLITCSFYHPGPLHKISSQSVHNALSNVANKKDIKTDKQTNATKISYLLLLMTIYTCICIFYSYTNTFLEFIYPCAQLFHKDCFSIVKLMIVCADFSIFFVACICVSCSPLLLVLSTLSNPYHCGKIDEPMQQTK